MARIYKTLLRTRFEAATSRLGISRPALSRENKLVLSIVFEMHNLDIMWFSNLLHAKLCWMPSVCYISNYYLQNCVILCLVPLLLRVIGNLLAYVAALFVTSVCRLLSVLGREDKA